MSDPSAEPTKEQYEAMSAFVDRAGRELEAMTDEMRVRVLTSLIVLTRCVFEVKRRLP